MREKGSRYPERERERQGLNRRGTVSEREGEQASWRRGKPGTNGIRSANESGTQLNFFLEISWLLSGQLGDNFENWG